MIEDVSIIMLHAVFIITSCDFIGRIRRCHINMPDFDVVHVRPNKTLDFRSLYAPRCRVEYRCMIMSSFNFLLASMRWFEYPG